VCRSVSRCAQTLNTQVDTNARVQVKRKTSVRALLICLKPNAETQDGRVSAGSTARRRAPCCCREPAAAKGAGIIAHALF